MEKDVEIGIFGGTGIYDSGLLENAARNRDRHTIMENHQIQ